MKRKLKLILNLSLACIGFLSMLGGCLSSSTSTTVDPNTNAAPPSPVIQYEASALPNTNGANLTTWPNTGSAGSAANLTVDISSTPPKILFPGASGLASNAGSSIPYANTLPSAVFGSSCMVAAEGFPKHSDFHFMIAVRVGSGSWNDLFGDAGTYPGSTSNSGTYSLYSVPESTGTPNGIPANLAAYASQSDGTINSRIFRGNPFSQVTNVPAINSLLNSNYSTTGAYYQAGYTNGTYTAYPNVAPAAHVDAITTRDLFDWSVFHIIEYTYHQNITDGALTSVDEAIYVDGVNETTLHVAMCFGSTTPLTYTYGNNTGSVAASSTCYNMIDSATYTTVNSVPVTMAMNDFLLNVSGAEIGTVDTFNPNFNIGCYTNSPQRLGHFGGFGQIAEVRIYDQILTPAQQLAAENDLNTKYNLQIQMGTLNGRI